MISVGFGGHFGGRNSGDKPGDSGTGLVQEEKRTSSSSPPLLSLISSSDPHLISSLYYSYIDGCNLLFKNMI